jgi:soluble epoxide hydrolase / lipid-phosphate phosphatase
MTAAPEVQRRSVTSNGHTTSFLVAGPEDGPLVFIHGWPELAISWRHQLPVFAGLGFRVVAPDMRGYGESSTYATHDAFAQENLVADMVTLLDGLGRERAIWVGHDWGSPVVWNIASHHPNRCVGVANLCVPYRTLELGLDATLALIDRSVYPAHTYPYGQWDYQVYYEEHFERATAVMDANPSNTLKALFRSANPAGRGKPTRTALIRAEGGWFGGADVAPDVPLDTQVLTADDLRTYAQAMARNGFFGPNSYYRNHQANATFAATAPNSGRIELPALFLAARYDYTCEAIDSAFAVPMHDYCSDLTTDIIDSGHWMAQEKPAELNRALTAWLVSHLPDSFP